MLPSTDKVPASSGHEAADKILREIEGNRREGFLPIIGPEKGRVLDDAVSKKRPKLILEIGTLVGYSAIRMARMLAEEGGIICVEKNPESARKAERNIERAGFAEKVKVVVGDAKKVIPTLEGIFDLVFIDAEKKAYLTYLKLVEGKLRKGAVVVADNALMSADEMEDYLTYVRSSGRYESRYVEPEFVGDFKDAVEISIKQ